MAETPERVAVYLEPSIKRAIEALAAKEKRSMSAQIAWIVYLWLAEHGALEEDAA